MSIETVGTGEKPLNRFSRNKQRPVLVKYLNDYFFESFPKLLSDNNDKASSQFGSWSIQSLKDDSISKIDIVEEPTISPIEKNDIFAHKDILINESWSNTVNIQARILNTSKVSISCECLIDSESLIFENRDFPSVLFNHLDLDKIKYVLISIKTKSGTMKIDVYKGDDFVKKDLFEDDSENDSVWNKLEKSDFIKPFAYHPK